eukprot:10956242-Karenia_brevis.AAC.1
MFLCPQPELVSQKKKGNWDFFCDVLQKLELWTDLTDAMTLGQNTFTLCVSDGVSHKSFHDKCISTFSTGLATTYLEATS